MLPVLKDGILGTPALNSFPILTHAYNKDYALFQGSVDNIIMAYTAVTWQGNMLNMEVTEEGQERKNKEGGREDPGEKLLSVILSSAEVGPSNARPKMSPESYELQPHHPAHPFSSVPQERGISATCALKVTSKMEIPFLRKTARHLSLFT